jgi:hypothetical protein
MKIDFLKSTRFWGLVIIAVIKVLEGEFIISSELANSIYVLIGGFIGIRTIDKTATKISGV